MYEKKVKRVDVFACVCVISVRREKESGKRAKKSERNQVRH